MAGPSEIPKYRKTLRGNARTKWDLSVAAGHQNFQIASFFQNIQHMVAQMAGPQAYDKFVDYMHHVKKPASMDPSTLVDRAQTLFCYATYLLTDDNAAGPEIPVHSSGGFCWQCSHNLGSGILPTVVRTPAH
jgi:hypothetical protein